VFLTGAIVEQETEQQRLSARGLSSAPPSASSRAATESSLPPPSLPLPSAARLDQLLRSFAKRAGDDEFIDRAELAAALKCRDELLVRRVMTILDEDQDGKLCRPEFLEAVRKLVYGSEEDKLKLAFRIHDLDGNGRLERSEIRNLIAASLLEEAGDSESSGVPSMRARERQADRLTELLFQTADYDADQSLSFEEFARIARADPRVLALVTERDTSWLLPELRKPPRKLAELGLRARYFLDEKLPLLAFFGLWAIANVTLFVAGFERNAPDGNWLRLAHGFGACLNLNGALVLVPVTRRMLTWVRNSAAGRFLPLDDASSLHRFLGASLFFMGVGHTLAHLLNYGGKPAPLVQSLLGGKAAVTGVLLLLVTTLMFIFAQRPVRERRYQLFYVTHFGYVVWLLLALVHGPRFWKFALFPLLAFAVERLWSLRCREQRARVISLSALPSGVSRLEVECPQGFRHHAGEYAFLRLPALARHEWHPFTICNAPGKETLLFHVRSAGDWTSKLRLLAAKSPIERGGDELYVNLDGPFGAPSEHIFDSAHAVMIGAGIGVTPFASILDELITRAHSGQSKLQKLYFFWLNSDSRSFAWFSELLLKVQQYDVKRLVDVRVCMTGGRGDISALALNLARNLQHDIGKPDYVTGLDVQTRVGPPDFEKELAEIAAEHRAQPVDVFYCGPPSLGRTLERICRDQALRYRTERF
jgi:predicted ferric reductase/Ca2+-binding EF-hand superfamily protein